VHFRILLSVVGYLTTTTLWLRLREHIRSEHLADGLFIAATSFLLALALHAYSRREAIANARLYRTAQEQRTQLEALFRTTDSIMAGLDLPTTLRHVVEGAAAIARCEHIKLLLLDPDTQTLRLELARGFQPPASFRLPVGAGLSGIVAATRKTLYVPDADQDPRNVYTPIDRETHFRTYLGIPISIQDELVGVLSLSTVEPRTYSPEDLTTYTLFANQAAIAIANARLYEAQRQAYADLQRAQDELVRTEKLRALGQLTAGLAHDLNNTLSAIIIQAELLQLRHSTTAFPELQALSTAAHDSAYIVWRLREFSRQQSTWSLVPIRLATAVADALEITRPHWRDDAERRGASIEITANLESLPHVLGSPSEVREALTNLILNAVDAMPTGGALHFTGTSHPASTGTPPAVELVLQDTGGGIPEDIRPHIFDPFFTTKGPQGTGMGLAIVYRIMERLGGKISVSSQPGRGTAFTLQFQAADPPEAAPFPPQLTRTTTPLRILVVEDNSHVRDPLVQILAAIGHTPLEATDAASALAHFAGVAPDLVITDLAMPGMNGIDLAAAIRATHPQTPIILHTGWQDEPTLDAEVERGTITAVLEKPIDIRKLSAVIDRYRPTSLNR